MTGGTYGINIKVVFKATITKKDKWGIIKI